MEAKRSGERLRRQKREVDNRAPKAVRGRSDSARACYGVLCWLRLFPGAWVWSGLWRKARGRGSKDFFHTPYTIYDIIKAVARH